MSSQQAGEWPASEIRVTGGSHGLTVEYRELEEAAAALQGVVYRLAALRAGCAEMYVLLRGTSAAFHYAQVAVAAAEHVIRGLQRNIAELEETAADLRAAAENYLDVEGRLEDTIPWKTGVALGVAVWGLNGWGRPDRFAAERFVPPQDRALIEATLGLLAGGRYGKLRPVDVTKVQGDYAPVRLEEGTARALLDRSKVLLDGGPGAERTGPGVVEILTVYRSGRPVRIVTLPGTQDSGTLFVGPNPFDLYGNAEGRAEDSQYVADAVAEALRQAGASADDAVILVGYSQGGIHALNTGARLAEAGDFSVEMVVTAGSPAGNRNTPDGLRVLHFEHYQDAIPGLDGSSNPDTPDRITVTGTTSVEGGPDGGLGPGHHLDVYLELADQAARSTDPSLKDSAEYLAEIIGPGTIATRSLFRFTRRPASKSAPKPSGKPAVRPSRATPPPWPQAPPLPPVLTPRPGQ